MSASSKEENNSTTTTTSSSNVPVTVIVVKRILPVAQPSLALDEWVDYTFYRQNVAEIRKKSRSKVLGLLHATEYLGTTEINKDRCVQHYQMNELGRFTGEVVPDSHRGTVTFVKQEESCIPVMLQSTWLGVYSFNSVDDDGSGPRFVRIPWRKWEINLFTIYPFPGWY